MVLNLKKKAATQEQAGAAPKNPDHVGVPKVAGPKPSGLGFLKKGKAALEVIQKEAFKTEQKMKGQTFRFWVPKDKDVSITFLDGNIVDGLLDIPFYYEHNINMNGKYGNFFICTQEEEPCPICEGGSLASYVGVLTVIDHSEYVSKKDGLTKKDNVKLMAVKRDTVKLLQKMSEKKGGLRGCRYDVSRNGDKSPAVGNVFEFDHKLTEAELVGLYKEKATPIDYEKVLAETYLSAKELRKLGFGSSSGPIGGEAGVSDSDYDSEL